MFPQCSTLTKQLASSPKNTNFKANTIPKIGHKKRAQIAAEYCICYKTLMRRLKKLNIALPTGLLFTKQQKSIYEQ
ncbi:MAG: hypothetical protein AAFO82_06405 [Bacteroidota bacterium]